VQRLGLAMRRAGRLTWALHLALMDGFDEHITAVLRARWVNGWVGGWVGGWVIGGAQCRLRWTGCALPCVAVWYHQHGILCHAVC
jgi:hypothetical protein